MPQRADGWRVTTILAGAITAGTQIVLLREVLCAFLGNELVIGIMLFDWLALTGIGVVLARVWTARLRPSLIPSVVLGSLLVLPPLTLVGFRLLPLLVAPPGSMLEIWIFLVGAVLVLSPVCLVSGAAFSLLVRASAVGGGVNSVGSVYAWEAIGSLAGGALFGVLLFDLVPSQDLLLLSRRSGDGIPRSRAKERKVAPCRSSSPADRTECVRCERVDVQAAVPGAHHTGPRGNAVRGADCHATR